MTTLETPKLSLSTVAKPSRIPSWARKSITPILLLLIWEATVRSGIIPESLFAPPSKLPATTLELWQDGDLQAAIPISLFRALTGLAVGTLLGIIAALIAGLWRWGEDAVDPLVQLLRPIPATGLITLVVLILGVGEDAKILLIAFGTFFPVYLNSFDGIRSVDIKLVEAAGVFGLTKRGLVTRVIIPSAASSFFVGFRFSVGVAWLLLVIVEGINAKAGIGYLLAEASRYFRTDIIMVCLILYAVLGLLSNALVVALERGVLRWRRSFSGV